MFLKLSVPILATLMSSITNSYDQIGETTAASMVHPSIQNFEKYSLEVLGPQLSTETLRVYTKEQSDFHIHILESCPMALWIGRQVSRGHTFIWQHGQKPYIALGHRRCRVWCHSENRWYANRVQNDVTIFAIDSPMKPGRRIRIRMNLSTLNLNSQLHAPIWTPKPCFMDHAWRDSFLAYVMILL